MDVSEYAIGQVHESVRPYCRVGSITEPFERKYDLVTCIEVFEHMPAHEVERAAQNMCLSTDDILFSSTPFDYKEVTHVNVHPPEYWAALFARQGFYRDFDFDASFLTPWAVRVMRKPFEQGRFISEYERRFFLLWKENSDLRALVKQQQGTVGSLEEQVQEQQAEVTEIRAKLQEIAKAGRGGLCPACRRSACFLFPAEAKLSGR